MEEKEKRFTEGVENSQESENTGYNPLRGLVG